MCVCNKHNTHTTNLQGSQRICKDHNTHKAFARITGTLTHWHTHNADSLFKLPRLKPRCQCSPAGLRAPPFWLRAQSCARRAAAPICWLLLGSCAGFQCAREGIAGCRSPKGFKFRRPFNLNVVTRSFLKYRLRASVCQCDSVCQG